MKFIRPLFWVTLQKTGPSRYKLVAVYIERCLAFSVQIIVEDRISCGSICAAGRKYREIDEKVFEAS